MLYECGHLGRRLVAVAVIVSVAGCGAIQPYVKPDIKASDWPNFNNKTVTLGQAIDYANAWRQAYYKAVRDQALAKNLAAIALISMGAVALFYGIKGTNKNTVTALAVGGAGLYAGENYLYSAPRQSVYLAGSEAIGCAILAVSPLTIVDRESKGLKSELETLNGATTKVDKAIEKLRLVQGSSSLPDVEAQIDAARTLTAQSRSLLHDGDALLHRADLGALTLVTAVDTIVARVSAEIVKTEPSLGSIAGTVSGLGQLSTSFRPQPPAQSVPPTDKRLELSKTNELKIAQDELKVAGDELKRQIDHVARRLEALAAVTAGTSDPGSCKVKPVDGIFRVLPEVDNVTLREEQTTKFAVSGGTGVVIASFVGPSVDKLEKTVDASGGVFVISLTAQKGTPGGTTQLLITDQSVTNRKSIVVTVEPASKGKNPPEKPTEPPAPKTEYEKSLKKEDVELIQAGVEASLEEVDGQIDSPKTRELIRKYQRDRKITPETGQVDKDLFEQIKSGVSSPKGAKNLYERYFVKDLLKKEIQPKLNVDPTGEFDAKTRTAIANFKPSTPVSDRPTNLDELSPGLVGAIRARP